MSHPLEYYYERELRYIRDALSKKYASDHPEAANALRIRADRIDDPAVQTLIDGFALLAARTARKLDDGNTEILEGLLNILYPDYLRPLPSMMIGQFELGPSRATQVEGQKIDAGHRLETEPADGEPCEFRTCWPIQILPVKLSDTRFVSPPFPASGGKLAVQAVSALRTRISCLSDQVQLASLNWRNGLCFFIHESRDDTFQLPELFFRHLIGIAVRDGKTGAPIGELSTDAIEPVGFDPNRGILAYSPRSFYGYGLLTDLFVYSLRYSFFQLRAEELMTKVTSASAEIVFYFGRQSEQIESTLSAQPLRLGCCPLINLYEPAVVAAPLDPAGTETAIVVDWERLWKHEIYSVDRVELFDPNTEQTVALAPIYSPQPGDPVSDSANIFSIRREFVGNPAVGDVVGSDVFLAPIFLRGNEFEAAERAIYRIWVTALNRDLPLRLPTGERRPRVFLKDGITGLTVNAVTSPSRTVRPVEVVSQSWRVVSHLNLNHVSLLDAEALKSLLHVYQLMCRDDPREELARNTIESITHIEVKHVTERIVFANRPAFVRGQEIQLHIDSAGLPPGRAFLFAAVLSQFLTRYGTVNSFVRTTAIIDGKEVDLTWNRLGTRMVR